MPWYVYILRCQKGLFYTGLTQNLNRRYAEHLKRQGALFTRGNKPQELLFTEKFVHKCQAEKREKQIKRWSKAKKQALIDGKFDQLRNLSKSRD